MKKVSIFISIFMVIGLLLTACGNGNVTPSATTSVETESSKDATKEPENLEPVNLKVWAVAVTGTDETKKPQNEWVFTGMLREYEKLHKNVKIEFTVIPDQVALHQTIKASAMAKNGPDIVNLWAGTYVSALKEILLPLNDMISAEDLDQIIGWETVTDTLTAPAEGGKILGYPLGGLEVGIMEYNKKLVAKAGLDFENNPPKTVEEFIAALDTLKKSGTLPIASADMGYNALVSFVFSKWWAQDQGFEQLTACSDGTSKFADSKGFIDTFQHLQDMYKKGYINKDYATLKDAGGLFFNGKAALYPTGNWDIDSACSKLGVENVGILEIPDLSPEVKIPGLLMGGVGQSLCVLNYTEFPEDCVGLLSYLARKENAIKLGKNVSKFPLRRDVTFTDMGYTNNPVFEKVFQMSQRGKTWHEFAMNPEVVNESYKYGTLAVIGKISPQEMAEKLDAKVQELKK